MEKLLLIYVTENIYFLNRRLCSFSKYVLCRFLLFLRTCLCLIKMLIERVDRWLLYKLNISQSPIVFQRTLVSCNAASRPSAAEHTSKNYLKIKFRSRQWKHQGWQCIPDGLFRQRHLFSAWRKCQVFRGKQRTFWRRPWSSHQW